MSNAYCDLAMLKSGGALNISGGGYDRRLLALLEEASRLIDGYCNRHFYVLRATRQFEADHWKNGPRQLVILDLIGADSVRVAVGPDVPGREPDWQLASYRLYPLDAAPERSWGRPYTRMAVESAHATQGGKGGGPALVEIAGRWGYRQVVADTGVTLAAAVAVTDATLTVSDGAALSPGQTLAVGDEQVYVTAVSSDVVTVERGVNGTAAASHVTGAGIGVYQYPPPVVEACLQLAMRRWHARDLAEAVVAGLPRDVESLLSAYRKLAI